MLMELYLFMLWSGNFTSLCLVMNLHLYAKVGDPPSGESLFGKLAHDKDKVPINLNVKEIFFIQRYPNLDTVIQDLREDGVRVTAYINPYLNVKGDIYQDNELQDFWITEDQGQTLIQDFGQFSVCTYTWFLAYCYCRYIEN